MKNLSGKNIKNVFESSSWRETVKNSLEKFDIHVDCNQLDLLGKHAMEMIFWNRTTNLTAITDPYDVAVKHVVDSCVAAPLFKKGERVLDLGTGAGFPGIPLKIIRPDLFIVLLDSSRKKISFLKHVIRTLELENIRVAEGRAEELSESEDFKESFNAVVSRAFSGLDIMIPMSVPFLGQQGRIIAMKGRDIEYEKKLFYELSSKISENISLEISYYQLPETDFKRAIMILGLKK